MDLDADILEKLKIFGVGQRKLDDGLFAEDKPPPRLGVFDIDDENLCHEVITSSCNIPGCHFTTDSLLEFENHYNALHKYACSQCKKMLPSPHFLDLHIQEKHDSFFAVMALKKPSYCCYIEECKEKFINPDERLEHCVHIHKLPKDFRFDERPKKSKGKILKTTTSKVSRQKNNSQSDEFLFSNSRQQAFSKYTGKKFTSVQKNNICTDVNMDEAINDLKDSLPS